MAEKHAKDPRGKLQQLKLAKGFPPAGSNSPNDARWSRDEMNLAEFPLAVLSTRANKKLKTLEFSDFRKLSSGEVVERKWIITGADKFGLPTSTDDDVVLGLIRLTMEKGFKSRKVYFTRYELLKVLRWTTEGRSYKRLIKSLDRLSGVRIRSSNSFYDNQTKSYQTKNFGIIDEYEVIDQRGTDNTGSYFIWSEALYDSFRVGFIKKLDLDFYFSLNSAVSRRLYRYLDKNFYYRDVHEMPLFTFAFEKLGLSRNYKYVSSIKQQLAPAAEELKQRGFLLDYSIFGKGKLARIQFVSKKAASKRDHENSQQLSVNTQSGTGNNATGNLISALVSRGLTELQCKRLLKERTSAELKQIANIISYFDHLQKTGDQKLGKNPIGFLYRAVERPHNFRLPTQFAKITREEAAARRPELKLFKSKSSQNLPRVNKSSAAKVHPQSVDGNTSETRKLVIAEIESKMKVFKGLVSEQRYQELYRQSLQAALERAAEKN